MGFYSDHVAPRLVEKVCGMAGFRHWRAETAGGLTGQVLEIGFGSGLNVEFYPEAVTRVLAVEPSSLAVRRAQRRLQSSSIPVELIGLDGQAIPLNDGTCDSALCTFSLCTIPDPALALAEVRRVLRPGGALHFLEHGLAPDPSTARWQRRLDPLERRVADGCYLSRDPIGLLRDAGFTVGPADQGYGKGPKPWSYFSRGVASSP